MKTNISKFVRADDVARDMSKFYHKHQTRRDKKTPYFDGHLEPVALSFSDTDWSLWGEIKHADFRYAGVDVDDWHGSVFPFLRAIAYLHDAIEDVLHELGMAGILKLATDLVNKGIEPNVAQSIAHAVALLSKNIHTAKHGNTSYLDYLSHIVENPYTRAVKLADIRHNISDLEKGNMKDKYELAINYLMTNYKY
jgi:hypothetical protein